MTKEQKNQINRLRNEGFSYSKIAQRLCISENTVKSYCRRNNLNGVLGISSQKSGNETFCKQCGALINQPNKVKPKRFCSDDCRMAWWNAHPESVNRKAIYKLACAFCGREFESYGNKGRKFCNRVCYGKSKSAAWVASDE